MSADTAQSILARYWGVEPSSSHDRLLGLLVQLARTGVHSDESSILVLDTTQGDLVFARTATGEGSGEHLAGRRVPRDEGLVGLAVATGEVQIGAPRYRGPSGGERVGALEAPAWTAAAPLVVGDEVLGALTVVRFDEQQPFSVDDGNHLATIAAVCALVLMLTNAQRGGAALMTPEEAARHRVAERFGELLARCSGKLDRLERLIDALDAIL